MGCGNSRNICEDLKVMLDRMRGMIDNKERMLKEKDDKEVRKINDELHDNYMLKAPPTTITC